MENINRLFNHLSLHNNHAHHGVATNEDKLSQLPQELVAEVLSYLSAGDLRNALQLCKKMVEVRQICVAQASPVDLHKMIQRVTRLPKNVLNNYALINQIKNAKQLPNLKELQLEERRFTKPHLELLNSLKDLESLKLDHSRNVTGTELQGLTNLRQLELRDGKNVTDEGIASLKLLTKLKHLNLSDCKKFTGKGVQEFNQLSELYLAGSGINKSGLKSLQSLTQLDRLDVSNCKKMPQVEQGSFGDMEFTREGDESDAFFTKKKEKNNI